MTGYQTINLKWYPFLDNGETQTITIPGIGDQLLNSNNKPLLLVGLQLDGVRFNSVYLDDMTHGDGKFHCLIEHQGRDDMEYVKIVINPDTDTVAVKPFGME